MIEADHSKKFYPVVKIAAMTKALQAEGISSATALQSVGLAERDLHSPLTRVSLNQVVRCYRNALHLSANRPFFAYRTGLQFHVSTYGMYGFAILSGTNFRETMRFAVQYHDLATPLVQVSFREEGDRAIWTIVPIAHPDIDAALYKFLVELHFGIHASLHRDIMGHTFRPREIQVTYEPTNGQQAYPDAFGCPVVFARTANQFIFDVEWLNGAPELGNELTHLSLVRLCDQMIEQLRIRAGTAGNVREVLLTNLARPTSFTPVARQLGMTTRTLARRLHTERTSFRKIADELHMDMAIKYLRDTSMTVEDIAICLGYSDAANFRHAFRRWTRATPGEFRRCIEVSPDDL